MFIPLVIALSQPVNIAQAQPCKLSVIGDKETNNCPLQREYSLQRNGQLSFLIGNPERMFLKE